MIRTIAIVSLFTAVSAWAQATAKAGPDALRDQTDKVFAKWDSTVTPGCALSVMKEGQIVYKRGYGMADLDHDVAITPATVFHVVPGAT